MNDVVRRIMAAVAVAALAVLVADDLWDKSAELWWDHHSFAGSVTSSLLVLAVTGLVIDEVVARRQRRQRSVSVAVQALIVFGQVRRVGDAIAGADGDGESSTTAGQEVQTLASMLLTASPSLFDDPVARQFLEEVQRFSFLIYRKATESPRQPLSDEQRQVFNAGLSQVQISVQPLLARIPDDHRTLLEGPS